MYSALVADRRLHAAAKLGIPYKRLPVATSIEIAAKLEALRLDRNGKLLPDNQLARPLFDSEQQFINSETHVCKFDLEYFFTRYYQMSLDAGVGERTGIGQPILLESQRRIIELWGRREVECYEELKKHKFTEGILCYIHKVRQIAATATTTAAKMHRCLFWPGTRAFTACLTDGESGTGEIFTRDKIAYDNLPFWMKPSLSADVKDSELGFTDPISSRMTYQSENQKTGIGTGTQKDFSHLTEVALWSWPERIRFSFIPAIPKAITTFHVQESTANGKGYWKEVTESARKRKRGYESWTYIFIPWYMNSMKYRANVPDSWRPEEHTIKHAELIERTSPEFFDGKTIRPSRSQLYWWEGSRKMHSENGELASFLTNYPATPEQSFQSFSNGALPVELIEKMETRTKMPEAIFDVDLVAA